MVVPAASVVWWSLAVSTLASEDLACLAAGLLVQQGVLSPWTAVSACAAGIFAGDLGLWALGRWGGAAVSVTGPLGRRLVATAAEIRTRLARGIPFALVISRFLPGTRLPFYVTCGLSRVPLARFALYTAVAVAIWTPSVVLSAAWLTSWSFTLASPVAMASLGLAVFAAGTVTRTASAGTSVSSFPLARIALGAAGVWRRWAALRVERLRRWEFWPMWAFYAPIAPRLLWLGLRHGGVRAMTAANPGMPDGGTVGESKSEILAKLPAAFVLPFQRIAATADAAGAPARVDEALAAVERVGRGYPVILKPDVGERGRGVCLARTPEDVERYCQSCAEPFLVQRYHPGPGEAGVFYYREPHETEGHILSITDKRFPELTGDGRSTLWELITHHPRFHMQADMFRARLGRATERVPAAGERVRLTDTGNHSKGTMFLDGEWLRTPELTAAIDAIARAYPGFYIGRFDVRYADVEAFRAGRDLAIVELNGVTAEPTDLYDPRHSLLEGWRRVCRQWDLVFRIGQANRRRGYPGTPAWRLLVLVFQARRRAGIPGES